VEPVDEAAAAEAVVETEVPDVAEGAVPDAAPAEATSADATPAEPEFDEVWFPGGRRNNDNNHRGRYSEGRQRKDGDAEGQQGRRNDRPRHSKGPRRPEGEVQDL